MKKISFFSLVLFFLTTNVIAINLASLKLPPGFKIEIFSDQVPDARQMALGEKGTVFVGTRTEGKVYAIIPDKNKNGTNKVIQIASKLNMPNGVAFHNGSLYVAEINRILRYDNILDQLEQAKSPTIIFDRLPKEKEHGWKYIGFGPDGKLYLAIGVPCNVCIEKNPVFGTISRINADGSAFEIYAKGIRNSVGFDWDPTTKQLWFTENGRDWMGDDQPFDELNYAPTKGLDFGFPYYDANLRNKSYSTSLPLSAFVFPAAELPPHAAALGMKFYNNSKFPSKYQHAIFIAEHGSWNRTKKSGYQVMVAYTKGNKIVKVEPFITGWLENERNWGRPVDILTMPDGSLLISDDGAGAIYRVSYKG